MRLVPLDREACAAVARDICAHHSPTNDQIARIATLRKDAGALLAAILQSQPASPERSTAVAKVREALHWANAGVIFGPDTLGE